MNYIGIDPSITSTGMIINGKPFSYSYESSGYNKSGLSKWYQLSEHIVNFRFHNQAQFIDYKDEQIVKIKLYKSVVSKIIIDIKDNIDNSGKIVVAIEGYSYGSSAGNLIDLVTFGTLLRNELLEIGCDITIVSPMTLKLESCKLTYQPIEEMIGKKNPKMVLYYKNNEGVSGGNFTKKEMFRSVIENNIWDDDWKKHLESIESDIGDQKIPKPHEDIIDSYLLYQYIKSS